MCPVFISRGLPQAGALPSIHVWMNATETSDSVAGEERGNTWEMGGSVYLPTENKAWENSPCLLGAGNAHVLPRNVRWCWKAAGERWSDPVPERQRTGKRSTECRSRHLRRLHAIYSSGSRGYICVSVYVGERQTRCLFKAYHVGSWAKLFTETGMWGGMCRNTDSRSFCLPLT